MSFAWPWALLGLLALPALATIYWLRQRARRRPVSSLLLWREAPRRRASGRRFERFEAGRLFPLELLILTLLAVAAAGPRLALQGAQRPLIVVLDDSFSMLVGGDSSPKNAAVQALRRELASGRHGAVTLIAAGERPQVLDGGATSADAVAERLDQWRASSPAAQLEPAIALAAEIGSDLEDRAGLLVLTDREPSDRDLPAAGGLAWWAFGRGASNLALVGAVRRPEGRGGSSDICLLEVANYSPQSVKLQLEVAVAEKSFVGGEELEIAAGDIGRLRLPVPHEEVVRVRIGGIEPSGKVIDALELDDQVVLLPERKRGVRVALEIDNEGLRRQIREALTAAERAILLPEASDRVELVISDRVGSESAPATWRLRLNSSGSVKPYLGPFVLDRGHPLTAGLSLDGVIWGAGQDAGDGSVGDPVITAGDVTLLADRATVDHRHDLTLYWSPDQSTLQRTPNWPILWWNLLEWRARSVPGVLMANQRLGSEVTVGLAEAAGEAELELPDGSRRRWTRPGQSLAIRTEQLGIHRLHHGGRTDRWAVNALAAEESDLRRAKSGRWGGWNERRATGRESRSVAWVLLLAATAGGVLHLAWSRGS